MCRLEGGKFSVGEGSEVIICLSQLELFWPEELNRSREQLVLQTREWPEGLSVIGRQSSGSMAVNRE